MNMTSRTRGIAVIRSNNRRTTKRILEPSKYIRKTGKKLRRRLRGYVDVPAAIRGGFHEPGSQNRNKH